MLETFMKRLINKLKSESNIVIVGAGKNGKELLTRLIDEKISVSRLMDNNREIQGTEIDGVKVFPIEKLEDNAMYLVSVGEKYRDEIVRQLLDMGVSEDKIVKCYLYREYEYMRNLPEKYYKDEVMEMYREGIGKEMNYDNPQTYNEKISWEKLNIHDPMRTKCADKYLVRDYVKEKVGEEHLTKLYGVWDDANEIDFSLLPNSFVLKTNHGGGCNIVVKDKKDLNIKEAVVQLNKWKEINFFYLALEWQYKNIPPKIICEEYLEGIADDVYDYQFYCFHGEPKYIWCINGSHKENCKASFYNENWEMLPFAYGYPKDEIKAPRPPHLKEMLNISKILCEPFSHVRVDMYDLPDGRVLVGEMTFTTWAGRHPFYPDEWDAVWGKLI